MKHHDEEEDTPAADRRGDSGIRIKNNWVNTTLLTIIICMLGWFFSKGFDKIDALNTNSIEMKTQITGMKGEIADVKTQVGNMVTRSEFLAELKRRDDTIAEQAREISQLRRGASAMHGQPSNP
jgi:hypothetical protein